MPSIVGPIKINNVDGGVINFGDTFYLAPKSQVKSASGSGGGNAGDFHIINNGINVTNMIDPDVTDQPMVANN
jgi:spore germination protein PF